VNIRVQLHRLVDDLDVETVKPGLHANVDDLDDASLPAALVRMCALYTCLTDWEGLKSYAA
jgi:hypothetical protein